jgi:hypothetical protein
LFTKGLWARLPSRVYTYSFSLYIHTPRGHGPPKACADAASRPLALYGDTQGGDSLHLHHYFLAWSISLLAQFQHPLSVGLLAVTAGIFVQGIGVSPSVGIACLLLFSFRVRPGAVVSAIPVGDQCI